MNLSDDYKPKILIVDDTPENINILGELLAEYRRVFALNGKKAIEKAISDEPPDLILLDVMMPEMDGFEVCERLRENPISSEIPVIFVTALGEETDETRGLKIGAVDYISKPFSPAVVKQRVKNHLELTFARQKLQSQNLILEEKVSKRTELLAKAVGRIRRSSLEMIVRLSRAAEYKDDDTGAHVLRMSNYSAAVAERLGWDRDDVTDLLHAAPMHDVGKIGIPDNVLLKPGKLDDDEWKIMRRHCRMGYDILANSEVPLIQLAATVAITHHEKWDGNGYPRGLDKHNIPMAGRIVAIADVFDALTTRRPYKEPFSLEKSFAIIREGRGTHFDPEVVDAFFEVESRILEIKEKYSDKKNLNVFSDSGHDG
jgi:putative two-component system response regulator